MSGVRYVSNAYGTRAEIEAELRAGMDASRSPRRQREAEEALQELLDGSCSVTFGQTTYLVTEGPIDF